ncbi:hypothetical protein [uncultured Roseovarius sp.]|uniref:hypothetical protein n=1 Tax=uncultured Roseovarius sp. TaxID=293344 RepID=UPI00261DB705|nr:hypothetical protein [uncultured Roseovarius sp.]
MMKDSEPVIVTSDKSQRFLVDGYPFLIKIFRLETENVWTLEVVDSEGTSHVWDDTFATDKDARNAAIQVLESEGAVAFMHGYNVPPLRQP